MNDRAIIEARKIIAVAKSCIRQNQEILRHQRDISPFAYKTFLDIIKNDQELIQFMVIFIKTYAKKLNA